MIQRHHLTTTRKAGIVTYMDTDTRENERQGRVYDNLVTELHGITRDCEPLDALVAESLLGDLEVTNWDEVEIDIALDGIVGSLIDELKIIRREMKSLVDRVERETR
jgi:hypothetical protein